VDGDSGPRLPKPRAADEAANGHGRGRQDAAGAAAPGRRGDAGRQAARAERVGLVDVPGLLIVLGLVVAGFLLALALTHHLT
jgi:hypothetical protein